jgi:hypothetical protein
MLRRTKKLLIRIGAVGILAAALASAAIAADTTGALESNAGALSAAATSAVSSVSLPASAQGAAVAVLDAITGGSNPSVAASQRSDPEARAQAKAENGQSQSLSVISAAQSLLGAGTAGTVGMRPGWGCGDKNHEHSGPPGRPDADSPCNKNR